MNKSIKALLLGIILSLGNNVYSQSEDKYSCKQGNDKLMDIIPLTRDPYPTNSTHISVELSMDSNEIIGTRGYDALGDSLQWVSVTTMMPYTIYFKKDAELAMASANKVTISMPLREKFYYATFGVGNHDNAL